MARAADAVEAMLTRTPQLSSTAITGSALEAPAELLAGVSITPAGANPDRASALTLMEVSASSAQNQQQTLSPTPRAQ